MGNISLYKEFYLEKESEFGYSSYTILKVEDELETLITKLENNQKLDDDEQKFLNEYIGEYYPKIVDLSSSPKYDSYLKPIHKKIAKYYISNIENNNYESINFLRCYFLAEMCKEYNIRVDVSVGDPEYFKLHPKARAYHRLGSQNEISKLCYNPISISEALNYNGVLDLINYGFHELEHEFQDMTIKNEKLDNPQALLWAKDELVRKVIGNIFYKTNYWDVFYERDARDYALKRIKRVIAEYGDYPNKTYLMGNELMEDASYNPNILFNNVEIKEKKSTTDSSDKGKIEYKKESAIDLLDAVSTEYIKAYPYLINEYPVLKNIYTEKGQKKLLTQIQAELLERKNNEINDNPDKESEINKKYDELEKGIIETDHDLAIQSLCQLFDKSDEEIKNSEYGSRDVLKKTVNNLVKKVGYSYDDIMERLNRRIHELERVEKSNQVIQELKETRALKQCMISHITRFQNKYQYLNIALQEKNELNTKFKLQIDKYKYIATDEGYAIEESKTIDELDNDYKTAVEKLKEYNLSPMQFELYKEKLRSIYDMYKRDLKSEPFYDAEQMVASDENDDPEFDGKSR